MKRSKFSLSNYKLASLDMGELVPVGMFEVLPGDTVQQATNCLLRLSPLNAPVMHPVHVRIHHWYVPYRIIWEDFEDFITGGPDGNDLSEYPTITIDYTAGSPDTGSGIVGELADYLGVPTKIDGLEVSALPFRAYAMIYNEWYRDQDLVTEVGFDIASGADVTTNTNLQLCAWEKDYFTSARPWEQKGPSITVPLGTEAPIRASNDAVDQDDIDMPKRDGSPGVLNSNFNPLQWSAGGVGDADLVADLTNASAVTVNLLREALALQRYEEARARYGSRYVEYLRYLGVRSSDARLQRPEYLGGGRNTIQFSEVLQTAEGESPVGELKGHGIAAMRTNRYRRYFEEHGLVLTLMSIRPKTIYTQGLNRMWNRRAKEDFWQRELQHIGQQAVLNKEVYAAHATPEDTFGYQDRYDEYRRQESTVAGEFRESTLDFWHFAREFSSDPALNGDFVECVAPVRPFAVQTNDTLYAMAHHSIQARRMVARTGSSFIF